jgi:hypothetical protein
MAVIARDERRWTIKSMGLGHSQRNEVHGPQVEPDHPVEVAPASQLRGAVEERDALAEQLGLALGRLEGATMEPWRTADAWAVLDRIGGQ